MNEKIKHCPVCGHSLNSYGKVNNYQRWRFDCPKCKKFELTEEADYKLEEEDFENPDLRERLSREIVRLNENDPYMPPLIDTRVLENILQIWLHSEP